MATLGENDFKMPMYPQYQHKALESPRHIRLFKLTFRDKVTRELHGILEHFSMDDLPPFRALSYTWESAKFPSSSDQNQHNDQGCQTKVENKENQAEINGNKEDVDEEIGDGSSEDGNERRDYVEEDYDDDDYEDGK
jgi:hypothetical protein